MIKQIIRFLSIIRLIYLVHIAAVHIYFLEFESDFVILFRIDVE